MVEEMLTGNRLFDSKISLHEDDLKRATPSLRTLEVSSADYNVDLERQGFDLDKYRKSRPINLFTPSAWDKFL